MMQRIQDNDSKSAALSMLSMEELEVVKKVLEYTLAREATAPTGKRPLVANPAGLGADDMVVYLRMAEHANQPEIWTQTRTISWDIGSFTPIAN
jgi:hypothetical protein